jgi:hypothetical protein
MSKKKAKRKAKPKANNNYRALQGKKRAKRAEEDVTALYEKTAYGSRRRP